jgi:UDP-glucose 4-epimerase
MNVLVTGGAGYIGSIVAENLLRAGHAVTVYDNLCHGKREPVPGTAALVVGDLSDRDALSNAFRTWSPEAVMHFAALIEAGESMRVPERYFRNNTASTLTLLETTLELRAYAISMRRAQRWSAGKTSVPSPT